MFPRILKYIAGRNDPGKHRSPFPADSGHITNRDHGEMQTGITKELVESTLHRHMILRVALQKVSSARYGILPVLLPTVILLLLTSCSRYNPFADPSNADIVVHAQSFNTGDSLQIFSTESLEVVVTVKELVERITVSAPGNRLWTEDSKTVAGPFDREPFTFYFSYPDTGAHEITLRALRNDGSSTARTLTALVGSPLFQNDLSYYIGDTVVLKTPRVRDTDVEYIWRFGEVTRYSSTRCSLKVVLNPPRMQGTGELMVAADDRVSPIAPFYYAGLDTTRPTILCINNGYFGADTVYTGDTVFTFKVYISDGSDDGVDSASVNGTPFDQVSRETHLKVIPDMTSYTHLSPLRLEVYALDDYRFGNEAEETFVVIFSPDSARTDPFRILIESPEAESTVTSIPKFRMVGHISAKPGTNSAATLLFLVNDSLRGAPLPVSSSAPSWNRDLQLARGKNEIRITATDNTTGQTIAAARRVIIYDPEIPDTTGPRILEITADGAPAHEYMSPHATVLIGVKVVDEISEVQLVEIDGEPAPRDSADFSRYYRPAALEHTIEGTEVVVRAVDEAGNTTVNTVILYYNRKPYVPRTPEPTVIEAESPYIDTVEFYDPDGDTLMYSKRSGPEGLTVGTYGIVTWRPTPGDTGMHTVELRIWDGYTARFARYNLYVIPAGEAFPPPVSFATTPEEFPSFLEADRDTLRVQLRAEPGTGFPPYSYTARLTDGTALSVKTNPEGLVVWAPTLRDTGYHQLVARVADVFPQYDTVYARLRVLPPNTPAFLSVSFSADTLPGGVVDLNAKQDKDTIIFRIHDPDEPLAERYSLEIRRARSGLVGAIDSALVDTFSIVVDPHAFTGYDTVTAVLIDKQDNRDTLGVEIFYGNDPPGATLQSPEQDDLIRGSSVELTWTASDPDGDSLWFDVFAGTGTDPLPRIATTSDTAFALTGLQNGEEYRWRIDTHDWKTVVSGEERRFSVE